MNITARIAALERQARVVVTQPAEKKHPIDFEGMAKMIGELFTSEQVAQMNEELLRIHPWLKV